MQSPTPTVVSGLADTPKPADLKPIPEPEKVAALEAQPEEPQRPTTAVSIDDRESPATDERSSQPSRELLSDLQRELNRLGCEAGRVDGKWGSRSQAALEGFVKETGMQLSSTEPSEDMLGKLKGTSGRICPLVCSKGFEVRGNSCERIQTAKQSPAPAIKTRTKRQAVVKSRKKVVKAPTLFSSTPPKKRVFRETKQENRHMPFGIDSDGAQM